MAGFDIFVFVTFGILVITLIFLFYAKKRMDANEPILGWQRKQYLEETGQANNSSIEQNNPNKKKGKKKAQDSIVDLVGIKDIRYGMIEKANNEYSVVIATDSVNFDLLSVEGRSSIILGYQSLFRVVRFPVQILGQAVRQDLRKEEKRIIDNLSKVNKQTREYNLKVLKNIKERSEKEFRIARRNYYVVSYVYEVSKMASLTPEQREGKILQELYMRANTVVSMLKRAKVEAEILDSLGAAEVIKRALNRDRMLTNPMESLVERGKEKLSLYVSADFTSLEGFEDIVNMDMEEVKELVSIRDIKKEEETA